jgi:hypothetical protein
MDAEHPQSLPKIRTFAKDQARVQHREEPAVAVPTKKVSDDTLPITVIEKNPPVAPAAKPTIVQEEKITVSPPPAHIPAFHELKKKPITPVAAPPANIPAPEPVAVERKISVTAKKFDPITVGTLISDSKKSAPRTGPSFLSSIGTWFKALLSGSADHSSVYTVSTTERRKGIIQKATSKTGALFSTDSTALKTEVKRRQQETAKDQPTHLTWSAQTEVGLPLLTESTPVTPRTKPPVTVEFSKRSIPVPEETFTVPRPHLHELAREQFSAEPSRRFVPPAELVTNFERDDQEVPTAPVPLVTVRPYIQPAPLPIKATEPPPSVVTFADTPPLGNVPHTPNTKTRYLKNGLSKLVSFNTTLTSVILAGSIVSLILLLLIIRTFLGIISPAATQNGELSEVTSLSRQGSVSTLAISAINQEALFVALQSQSVPSSGVKELKIVSPDGAALDAKTLLTLLNFNTKQSLAPSVTEVRLGFSAGKRIIILKVTDATSVFGALLGWETSMAEDLSNSFGTGGLSGVSFTDKTFEQTDVRVLSDNGSPVLVYGFVDKDIVVITQDLTAFTTLLPSTR